jgi:signal transduction histidine kinase
MFQLFDNLVSNAIEFTPAGGRVEGHRGGARRNHPRRARAAVPSSGWSFPATGIIAT